MSETCDVCGFQYEAIYRVPNDVWVKICPQRQIDYRDAPGGGLLCMECAWKRARDAGVTLYFDAHPGWWPEER